MLVCIGPTGAPDARSVVDDVLHTNGLSQLKLEEVCQTSQISSPLAPVRDTIAVEDQKSDTISLSFLCWIKLIFIGCYGCVLVSSCLLW